MSIPRYIFLLFYRGFSIVELLEHPRTKKLYALKRITCHSTEDQINATKEIEYHRQLGSYGASRSSGHEQEDNESLHPGSRHILGLVGSRVVGNADIVHNKSSEVLLVLPYLKVISRLDIAYSITILHDRIDYISIIKVFILFQTAWDP